ncbi:MAG TPA: hypothetical protein VM451_00055 [Candidatus Limnocylindria bacterium]|nr:hypothetical protein [Candidatus Limnocylindria bacterium]
MERQEFAAGPGQAIVVYAPDDLGAELEPMPIYEAIAADAAVRAEFGHRIVSVHAMPLRHAAAWMGREGSGFQTRVAIVVVYSGTMPSDDIEDGAARVDAAAGVDGAGRPDLPPLPGT